MVKLLLLGPGECQGKDYICSLGYRIMAGRRTSAALGNFGKVTIDTFVEAHNIL